MGTRHLPRLVALALLSVTGGCGGMLLGGAGLLAHGGGVTAVEETARVSLGLAGADDNRRGALEVAGEYGIGQRLDAPGQTQRISALVDVRYSPEALNRENWSAFWLAGASLEFLSVDGFRDQMGGFLHAGLGGTYRLRFSRSESGLWTGLLLEAVGGALATVKANSTAEAAMPELPTAFYGGLRLQVLFEWWGYTTLR